MSICSNRIMINFIFNKTGWQDLHLILLTAALTYRQDISGRNCSLLSNMSCCLHFKKQFFYMGAVKEENKNQLYPVFLKLDQLNTLLVGAGNVGLEKLQSLLNNSPHAKITIVAPVVITSSTSKICRFFNSSILLI